MVTAAALAGCGSTQNSPPAATPDPSSSAPSGSPDVDLGSEVVAHGMLIQKGSTAPVQICIGPVLTSYPPQCEGPTLGGEFSWDGLGPKRQNGIVWTDAEIWAIGYFDPDAGETGAFTLTQPLRTDPPAGMPQTQPSSGQADFPQLCEDPYAGGGSKSGGGPEADTNPLTTLLPTLDGYVGSWVSDGSSLFNVLVTGDAAAAHREIRKVWKGGLCVEQRNLPTEADITAAQEALGKQAKDLGLLTFGGDAKGSLGVEATFVDATTRGQILEIVRPWLTPDQVHITSLIQPLPK